MTAVLPPPSNTFKSTMSAPGPSSPMQEPTPPEHTRHDDDVAGKLKHKIDANDAEDDAEDGDDNHDNSSNAEDGPSRKRRRSRKGLDKKFECPHDGCGKSYSRAEHLFVEAPFPDFGKRNFELTSLADTDIS